jgi:hypothetical protein
MKMETIKERRGKVAPETQIVPTISSMDDFPTWHSTPRSTPKIIVPLFNFRQEIHQLEESQSDPATLAIMKLLISFTRSEIFKKDFNLSPSELMMNEKNDELQNRLFGPVDPKTRVPFLFGAPTPMFAGLFREYHNYFENSKKECIILLGPSGASKTFQIQQEAQKKYMIDIHCQGDNVFMRRWTRRTLDCSVLSLV